MAKGIDREYEPANGATAYRKDFGRAERKAAFTLVANQRPAFSNPLSDPAPEYFIPLNAGWPHYLQQIWRENAHNGSEIFWQLFEASVTDFYETGR